MAKTDVLDNRWNKEAARHLLGRTIKGVRYMTAAEAEQMGWDNRPVVLELDNGALFWPSRDDEGNDGGALFGTPGPGSDGKDITLPVLRGR